MEINSTLAVDRTVDPLNDAGSLLMQLPFTANSQMHVLPLYSLQMQLSVDMWHYTLYCLLSDVSILLT